MSGNIIKNNDSLDENPYINNNKNVDLINKEINNKIVIEDVDHKPELS